MKEGTKDREKERTERRKGWSMETVEDGKKKWKKDRKKEVMKERREEGQKKGVKER